MTILVTGGAGFIGTNFINYITQEFNEIVVNLDKLTYAGQRDNLAGLESTNSYQFVQGDVNDRTLVAEILDKYRPRAVINFAAESHVDRSINAPSVFVQTNLLGTFSLLEVTLNYFKKLSNQKKNEFRYIQISTDEVYGSLGLNDDAFSELSKYAPNSPYSATKAGADHMVRAYYRTYGLPALTTNCSNNYGPFQFPEKLIPLVIDKAISGKPLPIYGDGLQIRDWLYVRDHCEAIYTVLEHGKVGQAYNIGGKCERANIDVVNEICTVLNEIKPRADGTDYASQIEFVTDRPGHDRRYAVDASKIESELGWQPKETFESGLRKTIEWFIQSN